MKGERNMTAKKNTLLCALVIVAAFGLPTPAHPAGVGLNNPSPTVEEVDDNAATFFGNWAQSKAKLLYYGDDYAVARGSGSSAGTATATFTCPVDIEIDAYYSVYARWTTDPNRCTYARYEIYDGNNYLGYVLKNQRVNGGAWQRLGTYKFTPDNIPRVVLSNANCAGANWVVADGIRWVKEQEDKTSMVDEAGMDYAGGNQEFQLSTGVDQTVRSVTITAPRAGYVVVNASGFFRFYGTEDDYVMCSITESTLMDNYNNFYCHQNSNIINRWYPATPFASTRGFSVTSGSHTYRLVCKEVYGNVFVQDSSITAIYVPTRY
jgi:hypothetical protein